MSYEQEPVLEAPFTYLLPMREDLPGFADFKEMRAEVTDVMGKDCPSPQITRICTMLAGNGLDGHWSVRLHRAKQVDGRWGSVRAVSFIGDPLTVEDVAKDGRGIGPVAARFLIEFAVRLQEFGERGRTTSTD